MRSLINAVREHDEAADFLAWPGDFDLDRGHHGEEVHLASGAVLEGFAGVFTPEDEPYAPLFDG